jgi:transposase
LARLLGTLDQGKRLDWREAFADGSFAPAKGAERVDSQGVPLGIRLDSASPAEVNLLEPTLATIGVPRAGPGRSRQKPERVIVDKAYGSDPLRSRLARRGIELIAPHRRNRKKSNTQDGRKLRRYRRRWKVERTFAWLGNFRRLVVRWERHLTMYLAFFHLACLLITLRRL